MIFQRAKPPVWFIYLKMLVWFVCQLDDEIPSGQNVFFHVFSSSNIQQMSMVYTGFGPINHTPAVFKLLAPPIAGCQLEICGKSTTTCKQ